MNERARQLLGWTLGLWAVGGQVQEAVATIGAWATALLAFGLAWPTVRAGGWGRATWVLLAFVGWSVLAPMLGGALPTGSGVARTLDWLLVPAAAFAVANLDERRLSNIGLAVAVTLVVSVALAGLQHFGIWPEREFFESLPWARASFYRVYETVPGRDDRFMGGGLLLHRLKFAHVTSMWCALGAAGAALRVRQWKMMAGATLIGLIGVAVFPLARAASVVVVLVVALVLVLGGRHRGRAIVGAVVLVGLSAAVVWSTPSFRMRFEASLSAEGSGDRKVITSSGLSAIAAHPLTGVGLGRFHPGLFSSADAPAQVKEHRGKAHNQFVTIAAESGLPAALLLLALLGLWLREALGAVPRGIALVGALATLVLLSLLHDPLFHAEVSLSMMLGLGGALGFVRRGPSFRLKVRGEQNHEPAHPKP